jgi:hypothetical protein
LDLGPDVRSSFATMYPLIYPGRIDRLLKGHPVGDFRPQEVSNTLVSPDNVPAQGFLLTDLDQHGNPQWKCLVQQKCEPADTNVQRLAREPPLL